MSKKRNNNKSDYFIPIINLSRYHISDVNKKQLQLFFDYSYIGHNKHIKKNLAATLESVAQRTLDDVDHTQLQEIHEWLRGCTDIFTKNVLKTKHFPHHNLKGNVNNKNLVNLKGDKDSSTVIIDKLDFGKLSVNKICTYT